MKALIRYLLRNFVYKAFRLVGMGHYKSRFLSFLLMLAMAGFQIVSIYPSGVAKLYGMASGWAFSSPDQVGPHLSSGQSTKTTPVQR